MTPHSKKAPHVAPTRSRLLIIDDEVAVLRLLKVMLSKADYEVVTCESGAEGLRHLSNGVFDCVITDAVMPTMTGFDFVKSVRRLPQFGSIPILMLTRKRHRQDVKKAVEVGVTDYVLKPIDEHLFLDKVELCLKKGMGKRHVFELQISGPIAESGILLNCLILAISETDITLWTQVPISPDQDYSIKTKIFHEINIDFPTLKLLRCELVPAAENRGPGYEIKFAFFGLPEEDLRKIRAWIQKEAIKRKK